jgi:thiaminase
MLARVKGHVDNMALIIEKLNKTQKSGSELQEQAVEQMLPLVKELSANTTAAINYLNQNKARPVSDSYTQYLNKNAETARQLSSIISSLFEYQKSMAEIEKLRSKLVVSEAPTP